MTLLRCMMAALALFAFSGEAVLAVAPHADHHAAHQHDAHAADAHAGEKRSGNAADQDGHVLHGCGVCHHLMLEAAFVTPQIPGFAADSFILSHMPPASRGAAPPSPPPMI